jgi:hypothetical protein
MPLRSTVPSLLIKEEIVMAKLDTRTNVNDRTGSEYHIGNTSGDGGINPLGPADAPINPPSVVINANGGKPFNVTVGSTKIVTPA